MIRVRYPDGRMLQYNDAINVECSEHAFTLVNSSGWYAKIPFSSGALVESVQPCDIQPARSDLALRLNAAEYEIKSLKRAINKLKKVSK